MRDLFLMITKFIGVALLPICLIASATEPSYKPNPTKGKVLYVKGDPARGIQACIGCHGPNGNAKIPVHPRLAAQQEAYVYKRLVGFKNSDSDPMTPIAKGLTDEEMRDIAAYLYKQKRTPAIVKSQAVVPLGKKIYQSGIAEKNVPACVSCHGATSAAVPNKASRLAGQHPEYTSLQLVFYRSGGRTDSVEMSAIAKELSNHDIEAVANYLAELE